MEKPTLLSLLAGFIVATTVSAEEGAVQLSIPSKVQSILSNSCGDCHAGSSSEGNVQLDRFSKLKHKESLDLLNQVQEQIYLGLMPPADASQPSKDDRAQLARWASQQLNRFNASKLEDKLRKPEYGNYVNHDDLFSGEFAHLDGFTSDRRWLISEYIFDARVNEIINHHPHQTIDGKREYVVGDNNRRVNLTNPFLLPTNTGVRYYANTPLNGGHLLTMITNAKELSAHMVYLTRRDKRYLPAIFEIMDQEWHHDRVLKEREEFLDKFIETVLQEIYQDQHGALLPEFVRVKIKPAVSADGEPIKKSAFHAAQPGAQELILIFRTMQRHGAPGQTDEELIRKCEQEWFNYGHSERTIQTRLTFLSGYLDEFRGQIKLHRYAQRHKPWQYRPRELAEQTAITETIRRHRKAGDRYADIISKCVEEWKNSFQQQRKDAGPPGQASVEALVDQLFVKIYRRHPNRQEIGEYSRLSHAYIEQLGNRSAIEKLIQTLILRSEFVYRNEFGQGTPDANGRRTLSAYDASYALSYALTDSSPDEPLETAAKEGRLETKEDYRREVLRLLAKRDQYYVIDESVQRLQLTASITNLPIRKLRFIREFFGYPKMLPVFKDNKRFGGNYDKAKGRLVGEADRLVEHVLQADQEVFERLLTTENFYVYHSGDNEAMSVASDRIRKIYDHFKDEDWQNFDYEDVKQHAAFISEVKMRGMGRNAKDDLRTLKTVMTSFTTRFDKGQSAAAPFDSFPAHGKSNADTRTGLQLRSPEVAKFFNIELDNWNYPAVQPAPVSNRKGILTHPAWLIAHAQNTATDPVKRGRWVQEKLLAGTVPEIPITVDAVIPENHHQTLRQRLQAKTSDNYCWKCHQKMNPLGLPFEMYDDFGRYRAAESLEHPDNLVSKGPDKAAPHVDLRDTYKTLPVNAKGYLEGTGNTDLDGDVENAIDLIGRLAQSDRVRQSIIRHAFRYFLGRNEVLSDSRALIDADQAYLNSGGSFDAVIVSLLTSDSFMYRKQLEN